MNLKDPKGWAAFWFLNGGMLHGMWKRREYSGIYKMARDLPKLAWDTSAKESESSVAGLVEALEKIASDRHGYSEESASETACAALSSYRAKRGE